MEGFNKYRKNLLYLLGFSGAREIQHSKAGLTFDKLAKYEESQESIDEVFIEYL